MAACLADPWHATCQDYFPGTEYGAVTESKRDQISLLWNGSNWEFVFPFGDGIVPYIYTFSGGSVPCDPSGTYYDSDGDSVAISAL